VQAAGRLDVLHLFIGEARGLFGLAMRMIGVHMCLLLLNPLLLLESEFVNLQQGTAGEDLLNHLRDPLDLEMLLVQMQAHIIHVSVDNLADNLLSMHKELQMRWALKDIVQEIAVNSDQYILFTVLVDRGPDGQQLLLDKVELFLSL
jgi:hypothetical protein